MPEKTLDYEKFVKDFEAWVQTQIGVMKMAQEIAEKEYEENNENMDAAVAMVRYESRVDAYQFLAGKFENFYQGRDFDELPPELLGERTY